MSHAVNAALAFSLAQYAATAVPDPTFVAPAPKTPKVKGEKRAKKGKREATPEAAIVPSVLTVKPGTIDAVAFIAAMRDAGNVGKTLESGKVLRVSSGDPIKRRDDERNAIQAFVGYSNEVHGVQVANATRKAQFDLRPSLGRDKRKADPTIRGYVAGANSPEVELRKQIDDLAAREVKAAEAMADLTRQAEECDAAGDESGALLARGLFAMEIERVEVIRRDLEALIG